MSILHKDLCPWVETLSRLHFPVTLTFLGFRSQSSYNSLSDNLERERHFLCSQVLCSFRLQAFGLLFHLVDSVGDGAILLMANGFSHCLVTTSKCLLRSLLS